jgi:ubiquinone/menaquinone biosynthesis C-methylase UbiE
VDGRGQAAELEVREEVAAELSSFSRWEETTVGVDAHFIGSIPEYYDRHLGPVLFEPPALDLASRLDAGPGERVLELACGTGVVTRRLLGALPDSARLVATDLNAPMLDHARERIGEDRRLEWRVADATSLPFADGTFDACVCQFGVMFFPDKLAAMREARRVLRPGGRLLFNVWSAQQHNPFGRIADSTIAGFFESDPPRFYQAPFSWCDEGLIHVTVGAAGFRDVELERLEFATTCVSAADLAMGLVRGNPVLLEIHERATADVGDIEAALAAALAREGGERPWHGLLRALVVSASA